jgi:hypothetical protein
MPMTSKRSWRAYPATYRDTEITILADWVRAGESGSLIGLPGSGKSNLFGFLSRQPEAIWRALAGSEIELIPVYVDLNNLPDNELATFYRVILRALYEAKPHLADVDNALAGSIEALYQKVEDKTDPFLTQSALREILLRFEAGDICLLLMLDPFDQFCRTAPAKILDNLRGLRDSFKTTLCYLVGLRYELAYLRAPQELGELYELLDMHMVWLGPMGPADAQWVISQCEEATTHTFSEAEKARLIELTGGYPAWLRTAGMWLAMTPAPPQPEAWLEALLAEPGLRNRLNEVWLALTGEERLALLTLLNQHPPLAEPPGQDADDSLVLTRLQQKHICRPHPATGRPEIFSPLFAAYIRRFETNDRGKIWLRSIDDVILSGSDSLEAELTAQDRKLLLFFLEHPQKILSKDDIAMALWPEEEIVGTERGVDDARLQKAVSQLRGVLEKEDTARYIHTVRGMGYRFFPEGAPPGS